MLRTLLRRDVINRHSLKVSLSSKADPDQKLRDNVRYHLLLLLLSQLQLPPSHYHIITLSQHHHYNYNLIRSPQQLKLLLLLLQLLRVLGEMLGSIMKDQQPDVFNKVERLRKLGREV